jgi:hypothetical protein
VQRSSLHYPLQVIPTLAVWLAAHGDLSQQTVRYLQSTICCQPPHLIAQPVYLIAQPPHLIAQPACSSQESAACLFLDPPTRQLSLFLFFLTPFILHLRFPFLDPHPHAPLQVACSGCHLSPYSSVATPIRPLSVDTAVIQQLQQQVGSPTAR